MLLKALSLLAFETKALMYLLKYVAELIPAVCILKVAYLHIYSDIHDGNFL